MIKRAMLWFTRILIGLAIIGGILLKAYEIDPTLFDYFFEFTGLNPADIGNIGTGTVFIGGLGIVAKLLKTSVNTDLIALKLHYEQQLKIATESFEKREQELLTHISTMEGQDKIKYDNMAQEMEALKGLVQLSLEGQVISANRVKSYSFTSKEDYDNAEAFIKKVEATKEV